MKSVLKHALIENSHSMAKIEKGIDMVNKLGGDVRITELFEENGGCRYQFYGRMAEIEPLFVVYRDMHGGTFLWSLRKDMKSVPSDMRPCKICGSRYHSMYLVEVEGRRTEYVCRGCMDDIARIYSFLVDETFEYEVSHTDQFLYWGYSSSVSSDFVGYVLFYVENVYRMAVEPIKSLKEVMSSFDGGRLPTSEHTKDFIDWVRRNENRHYPSWFTCRFIDRGKVPVTMSGICGKLLEAALDYVNEKGIEMKTHEVDEGLPKDFWQRKWYTKVVTPIDLYSGGIGSPTIEFVGIADGRLGLFSMRSDRNRLRVADIVWGRPMKLRYMVKEISASWGNRRIDFEGKRLAKVGGD